MCSHRMIIFRGEICSPVDRDGATSGIIVVVLPVDCKGEAGVSSCEAGLEGILKEEDIGERNKTKRLMGKSKPEGVKCWKSSSGSERAERQS